jgi:uncharacterized membrane protein
MPADNVTPFRRPPKRVQKRQQGGMGFKSHRGKAVLVQLLTLATFVSAFLFPFPSPPGVPLEIVIASCISLALALVTVVLATQNRYDAMPWATTHHEHALRTLLFGFAIWTFASALTYVNGIFVVVAVYVHIAVVIWAVIRSGVGIVLALMRRPVWNPKGWLL